MMTETTTLDLFTEFDADAAANLDWEFDFQRQDDDGYDRYGFSAIEVIGDSILDDRDEELVDEHLFDGQTVGQAGLFDDAEFRTGHKALLNQFHPHLHPGVTSVERQKVTAREIADWAPTICTMVANGTFTAEVEEAFVARLKAMSVKMAGKNLTRKIFAGEMTATQAVQALENHEDNLNARLDELKVRSARLHKVSQQVENHRRKMTGSTRDRATVVAGLAIAIREAGGVHKDDAKAILTDVKKAAGADAVSSYGEDILVAAITADSHVKRFVGRLRSLRNGGRKGNGNKKNGGRKPRR